MISSACALRHVETVARVYKGLFAVVGEGDLGEATREGKP